MTTFAEKARTRAYAPYSKLQVGAALWTGRHIYAGCNVENASFGLTVCAERNALACAVAQGERPEALVVLAQTPQPLVPCGACRQVLLEFCTADLPVLCSTLAGQRLSVRLGELLPLAFERGFLPSTP